MRMFRYVLAGAAGLAALLASAASAQDPAKEVVLFSKGNFTGARYTVTGPVQGVTIPWVVKSIRLPEGESWDLCSGNTFSGCRTLTKSEPSTAINVRSARPTGMAMAKKGTVLPPGTLTEQSLRGISSEYFVAPVENGNRLDVQAGTPEAAAARANEFCRSRGWQAAAHHVLQSVAGRPVLADVLCVRTGG
jgi:hypothetical protein